MIKNFVDKKYLKKEFQRTAPYRVYIEKDGKTIQTESWACGKCGSVYSSKDCAERCCKDKVCSQCGKIVEQYRLCNKDNTGAYCLNDGSGGFICMDCFYKNREQKKCENAVIGYTGAVCYDDEMFDCIEEFIEVFKERYGEDENLPEIVECVDNVKNPPLDIDKLIEQTCEDLYEGAFDDYTDKEELYNFIKEWNEKQTATYCRGNGKYAKVPRGKDND